MMKFEHLLTETRHPDTARIDQLSTREMLEVINAADRSVADAVHAELDRIAQAVDGIAERMEKGGRLFYTGPAPREGSACWMPRSARRPSM